MTARYFHISFKFADNDPKIDTLTPAFNKCLDWFRYAPNCWVVWSNSSAKDLYKRFRPFIVDGDNLFVVAIDVSEKQGWMNKSFWTWINQDRTKEE